MTPPTDTSPPADTPLLLPSSATSTAAPAGDQPTNLSAPHALPALILPMLKSIPEASPYLKRGITVEQLDVIASRISDNEAALALHHARSTLFPSISAASRKQACAQPARQNDGALINPTEAEQGSDIQIHRPSFRLISGLGNTMSASGSEMVAHLFLLADWAKTVRVGDGAAGAFFGQRLAGPFPFQQ